MKKSDGTKAESTAKPQNSPTKPDLDWREGRLVAIRRLIREADPEAIEEQKWKKPSNPAGVPVWYHDGIICHAGPLKNRVRLTFLKGATLKDPKGLFNACLEGNSMRAIDVLEKEELDKEGIKALVRAAVAQNVASARR